MMKTATRFVLIFSLVTSFGCNFNPLGNKPHETLSKNPSMKLNKVVNKPNVTLLIGTWEIDAFSYSYIKEVINLDGKQVRLNLNKNGEASISNMPDFSTANIEKPTQLVSLNGTWKLKPTYKKDRWQLLLSFAKQKNLQLGFSGYYDLYQRNDSLFLWHFIGDPDSGNRLLFQRK